MSLFEEITESLFFYAEADYQFCLDKLKKKHVISTVVMFMLMS